MSSVFVPRERRSGETRLAVVPDTVKKLVKAGLTVRVERGAGLESRILDQHLADAGAELVDGDAIAQADLILKVQPPTEEECDQIPEDSILMSFGWPASNHDVVKKLRDRKISWLAMDLVPRISRAQSMDALSSQATIAGYKAVLLAASHLPKLCPLMMTAAGTLRPAKVVIFGAGVAGLSAIATAKRLGCVVEATDVRMAVKEQVESLGGRFIEVPGAADMEDAGGYAKEQTPEFLQAQREEVQKRVSEADIVITTALIPGRPAPVLVDDEMVKSMPTGGVIVDLAVETGGNVTLSEKGQIVEKEGITIIGIQDLPTTVPMHASELFSKNVLALSKLFIGENGALDKAFEDEVLAGCLLVHNGEIRHEPTAKALMGEGATA
ncbi:MAG: NAD(P) transhydrogenase subunit alpha [Planctomycetota bacterium]|jgi:NAD(P) transhydrogenase subunit alpha